MPIFDFLDCDEHTIVLNLTAIMFYPSQAEAKQRASFLARASLYDAASYYSSQLPNTKNEDEQLDLSKMVGGWLGEALYSLGGWPFLVKEALAKSNKKSLVAEGRERLIQGTYAAWIFQEAGKISGGCKTAARIICSQENDAELRRHGVEPRNLNADSLVNRTWPMFRDAAHLWWAFIFSEKKKVDKRFPYLLPLATYKKGGVNGFLLAAEEARRAGEAHIPPRGPRKPLIDPHTSWKASF